MSSAPADVSLLVNGEPGDRLSALDRGFTLGDGLFETLSVRAGRVRWWPEHIERLCGGCERLRLPLPDAGQLWQEAERCRGGEPDGTLRLTWTRGPGLRGYAPPSPVQPTRVVAWFPGVPPGPPRALRLRWCDTRLGENPALAGIKHLNRLEQVLARAEWSDPEIDEGVMCSTSGHVIECTSSNLFLVADGVLHTPDLDRCGVAGVVRRRVLEVAEDLAVPFEAGAVTMAEVAAADEVFVTNASRGVAPVGELGACKWSAPGPVTRRLSAGLEDSLR